MKPLKKEEKINREEKKKQKQICIDKNIKSDLPTKAFHGEDDGVYIELQKNNISEVDKTMDEINDQTENMKQIQEALSTPIGAAADFDEDKLEAELEQLFQPATTVPVDHWPSRQPQKSTA